MGTWYQKGSLPINVISPKPIREKPHGESATPPWQLIYRVGGLKDTHGPAVDVQVDVQKQVLAPIVVTGFASSKCTLTSSSCARCIVSHAAFSGPPNLSPAKTTAHRPELRTIQAVKDLNTTSSTLNILSDGVDLAVLQGDYVRPLPANCR